MIRRRLHVVAKTDATHEIAKAKCSFVAKGGIGIGILGASLFSFGAIVDYQYGPGNRLDRAVSDDGTEINYTYDAAGNLVNKVVTVAPSNTPSEGDDVLVGTSSNDVIDALGGDDTIDAGDGNDRLRGGAGGDVLEGGAGIDWALYTGSAIGVSIDLGANTASSGDAEGDSLSGIEYLVGSSQGDTLRGNNERNFLYGGGGDDVINGVGGNDVLRGDAGADVLDGGAGNDWAYYTNSSAGVNVNLAIGSATGGDAEGDTLTNIEYLHGSNHDDALMGDGARNFLYGREGDDVLMGAAGNDVLRGDAGADALDGGPGIDWAYYTNSPAGVNVNLEAGVGAGSHAEGDTLVGIERLNGSNHSDVLTGDGGANMLYGRASDDVLSGAAGNDVLRGGGGADALDGGAGIDWAYYNNSSAGVTVDLAANTASGGDAAGDSFASIERVSGSNHDDALSGDDEKNTLYGRTGNDILNGGNGNDILRGDAGADAMDGGEGIDWAYYTNSNAGVQVDLSTGLGSGGHATGDTLAAIEYVHGSNYADVLTGDLNRNFLYGRTGDDTLAGGDGDDVLRGDAGADSIDGGQGQDWAYYTSSNAGVQVDLSVGTASGGHATGDVLTNIEYVHGSNYIDTLLGDDARNVLYGRGGNDTISGAGGNDTLRGDGGNDTIAGGLGNDNYIFRPQDGIDTLNNVETDNAIATDRLLFRGTIDAPLDLWLTRDGDNLVIDVVATSDQVTVVDWYQAGELDQIKAGAALLRQVNVDALVTAMAAYAVPSGSVPQNVQDDLAPIVAATWE